MSKYLLGGALAAAMVFIGPAIAQTAQPAPTVAPPPMIERAPFADRAHTRAEVGTHVRSMFERLDSNRDGYVTKAEAQAGKAHRAEHVHKRIQRGAAGSPDRAMPNRGAMFDRMDSNRDGVISRDEFARAPMREEHRVVVRNGVGEDVRVREIGGAAPMRRMDDMRMGGFGHLRGRMFDMADANRDGRVSLQEANAAAYRHFDMADSNRDGQVTREERMQMRQRMRAERRPG